MSNVMWAKSVLLIAVLAAAHAAPAQTAGRTYRLGILSSGTPNAMPMEAFRQGLRELGWIDGQNIVLVQRFAEGNVELLPAMARELVEAKVDVIATGPTPPTLAAAKATRTIPIVMLAAAEPVELGLVKSFARPGGNISGVSWSANLEVIAKGLEFLKETLPKARRIGILWNGSNPGQAIAVRQLGEAAQASGLQLVPVDARAADQLERAFETMARQRVDAVLVVADALFVLHRARIAELEARHRLPSMHSLMQNVEAGGLIFYGPDLAAAYRRGAFYVDRILKGVKPADLPIEQPAKYDLVVNMKTARALGVTMPKSVLVRATQVLE